MTQSFGRLHLLLLAAALFGLTLAEPHSSGAQERRAKLRNSNAGFTITALPL
jgi:hypothetical protein